MEKKLIYKDTEYHTYSCTGKKTEIKRLEYKENSNLEERFKMQRLYGNELRSEERRVGKECRL